MSILRYSVKGSLVPSDHGEVVWYEDMVQYMEKQATANNKLNAAISALANELEFKYYKNVGVYIPDVVRKLRQLSSVYQDIAKNDKPILNYMRREERKANV